MRFGELLLFNTTSDCLETAWVSSWGTGLSIWIEIVLWKQGLLFLEPFKITDRRRWNMNLEGFYYLITTSDCLETAWVSSWGSGLSIWIKIGLWKQGLLFLEPFKIKTESGRIVRFWRAFIMELNIRLSWKLLECHPGVVGLSIWIEIVLWKQGLLFLEPFKFTDRTGRIWYWRAFIMELKHQIVWNYWVTSWG